MMKTYKDTPENFSEIVPYVIIDSKQAGNEITNAEKCYFYDTCSFRKHMVMPHPEYLFTYIKQSNGIVVITRCIIMELCSGDNNLWSEHIDYIRKMKEAGIKVLVIFEEDIFEAIINCYSSVSKVNKYLTFAIRTAKSKVGTVENTLKAESKLAKEVLSGKDNFDMSLFKRFFTLVRSNKASEDSLGEELIAICMHVLANIPEINEFKYVIFTEDKGAFTLFGKTIKNVKKYVGKRCVSALTTTKLAQLLVEDSIILRKEQVEEMLNAGNDASFVGIICSEKFELEPIKRTMNSNKLAEEIINKSGIHIFY